MKLYIYSKEANAHVEIILKSANSLDNVVRTLRNYTDYQVYKYAFSIGECIATFTTNSILKAVKFVMKLKFTKITLVTETKVIKEPIMKFYGNAPFYFQYGDPSYGVTFIYDHIDCCINRDYHISFKEMVKELFSEFFEVKTSIYGDPYVVGVLSLEYKDRITTVYKECEKTILNKVKTICKK